MGSGEHDLLSVEQVAERLGLHVRTVRTYIRDGRLKAVRIGKQYRIAREDLAALTGRPAATTSGGPDVRHRHVEVSSIVQIDAIDLTGADRLSTLLVAGASTPRDTPEPLRVQTVYDRERARLKIVVLGGATATADLLQLLDAILATEDDMFLSTTGSTARRA